MKCTDVQHCVAEYHEQMIGQGDRDKIEEHLRQCKACAAEYQAYIDFIKEIESLPLMQAPDGFLERLHARMDAQQTESAGSTGPFSSLTARIPAPIRVLAVAASVIAAVYLLFLTNLIPVSFTNKRVVNIQPELPEPFATHPVQQQAQNAGFGQKGVSDMVRVHTPVVKTAKDEIQVASEPPQEAQNGGIVASGQDDEAQPPAKELVSAHQTPSGQDVKPVDPDDYELAVNVYYETYKPQVVSVNQRQMLQIPRKDKEVLNYNSLGYYVGMVDLIRKVATESRGFATASQSGPYVVARIPVSNLDMFLSKLDQYGENKIILPPFVRELKATSLDTDNDFFVQIRLEIIAP